MTAFFYDILMITDDKRKFQDYKYLNNLAVSFAGGRIRTRIEYFPFSEDKLKQKFFDSVIIDTKQFEKNIINTVLFYNNQAEIFIPYSEGKPQVDMSCVKYIKKDDPEMEKKIVEFFYQRRYNTPFFTKLKAVSLQKRDRWFTPGHIAGEGYERSETVKDFKQFMKMNIFLSDLSVSDTVFGSLLAHTGVFKEAEKLLSNAYGTVASFINVHGTSMSNKILFMSILNKGDKVIVDRNVHKSIVHSIIVSGTRPVFLKSNISNEFGILIPTRKEDIFMQLDENRDAKLLVLSVPTYDGLRYYLPEIIERAHSLGMKVYVDEAWGAHLHFHPDYYPDALQSGADYVVQSIHKTMGGFSQASVIHVNDRNFKQIKKDFYENYMFFSSTSPFYPMVASIDVARKQMAVDGKKILERVKKFYEILVGEIDRMDNFLVLKKSSIRNYYTDIDDILIDYTRVVVSFYEAGIRKDEILRHLVKNGIIVEKINYRSFTLLLGTGTSYYQVKRLIRCLKDFRKEKEATKADDIVFNWDDLNVIMAPFEAYQSEGEWIDIRNSEGRVSSNMLVPYPPGIPLIIPGQVLTRPIIDNIVNVVSKDDIEIHGLAKGKLKVIKGSRNAKKGNTV